MQKGVRKNISVIICLMDLPPIHLNPSRPPKTHKLNHDTREPRTPDTQNPRTAKPENRSSLLLKLLSILDEICKSL